MALKWQQLRLLLWKDYLIRKRKWVTLLGIAWAVIVVFSLNIVRSNLEWSRQPTCQYPARALPSAGALPFLQSFLCTINNQCLPMDKYEEVPMYEKSKLRQIEKKLSGLIYNDTFLEVSQVMPDALKMVATLTKAFDEPDLHQIAKNGLKVEDLFIDSERSRKYIARKLALDETTSRDFMRAQINLQNVFKFTSDECSIDKMRKLLKFDNERSLESLTEKICALSENEIMTIAKQLMWEINFRKYLTLMGKVFENLTGEDWLLSTAEMFSSLLRLANFDNFIPKEMWPLFRKGQGEIERGNFTYFNLDFITRVVNSFEPVFGNTNAFRVTKGLADTTVTAVTWLHTLARQSSDKNVTLKDTIGLILNGGKINDELGLKFNNLFGNIESELKNNKGAAGVIQKISKIVSGLVSVLPKDKKHNLEFYATIMTKFLELLHEVSIKNIDLADNLLNLTYKHRAAINILTNLSANVLESTFDALVDAERTMIFTSKVYNIRKFFCDAKHLKSFFHVTTVEADDLKERVCQDVWIHFMDDVIDAFGILNVRKKINSIASLVVMETLGKDNSENIYNIEDVFAEFASLHNATTIERKRRSLDWADVLNVTRDSDIYKVIEKRKNASTEILLTMHGSFSREVVRQNPILEAKITPILIEGTLLIESLSMQIEQTPITLLNTLEMMYPQIIKTTLETLTNEEKTLRILSNPWDKVFCMDLSTAEHFLEFPKGLDKEMIVKTMCRLVTEVNNTLNGNSSFAKTVFDIDTQKINTKGEINWNRLITSMKRLHINLNKNFNYLMNLTEFTDKSNAAADFWFNDNIERTLHVNLKLILMAMDVLESPLFSMDYDPIWLEIKNYFASLNGFLQMSTNFIRFTNSLWDTKTVFTMTDLPLPLSVDVLRKVLPNLTHLIRDFEKIVTEGLTNTSRIVEILNSEWPCGNLSVAEMLPVSAESEQVILGFEGFLCNLPEIRREWAEYGTLKQIVNMEKEADDTLHFYLNFSGNFDVFVNELNNLQVVLNSLLDDSNEHYNKDYDLIGTLDHTIGFLNESIQNRTLWRKTFENLDTIVGGLQTLNASANIPLITIWEEYLSCNIITDVDNTCKMAGKAAWINTIRFLATAAQGILQDVVTYFTEVSEPDVNLLKMIGFTKNTGLYMLYDRFADFAGVLVNSYWNQGFMNQIRRAIQTTFWDCAGIIDSLTIPLGSRLTTKDINKVKPYVCPSVLYWVSLPVGENTLLNLFSRPQFFLFTSPVKNLNGSLSKAFDLALDLDIIRNKIAHDAIGKKNISIEGNFRNTLDGMFEYKLTEKDNSYIKFNEITRKQLLTMVYVTEIATVLAKIEDNIENLKTMEIKGEEFKNNKNITTLIRLLKRRPVDILEILFDVITKAAWNNEDKDLIVLIEEMCENVKNNKTNENILHENNRFKKDICSKNFRAVIEHIPPIKLENLRADLASIIDEFTGEKNVDDFMAFWKEREDLKSNIRQILSYSEDFEIHVYIKYLYSILKQNNVIVSFLNGDDWWNDLRTVYSGNHTRTFFENMERVFEIVEDIIENIDEIKLVKLLKAVNINETESFCNDNVVLSNYIPDKTGLLSEFKNGLCLPDKNELYKEITPLLFASQGYDSDLKISKEIDYDLIEADIAALRNRIAESNNGPKTPTRPAWITDKKLDRLHKTISNLFSELSIAKLSFAGIENFVDAITLFFNFGRCESCSLATTWLKQIRLQLIKKPEYEVLLCNMAKENFTLDTIYTSLRETFHWEIALQEVTSNRNYTNIEMNKSVNDLLDLVKTYYFQSLNGIGHKIPGCDIRTKPLNIFGNITAHLSTFTKTLRFFRATLPHLNEINGVKKSKFMETISAQIAPKLSVLLPIRSIKGLKFVDGEIFENVVVDITKINSVEPSLYTKNGNSNTKELCSNVDCAALNGELRRVLSKSWMKKNLPNLQNVEFWKMDWLSNTLTHFENLLTSLNGLSGVASKVDIKTVLNGKMDALLDAALLIVQEKELGVIIQSLEGFIKEVEPVLKGAELEVDLKSVSRGLNALFNMRKELLSRPTLKVQPSVLFKNKERIEFDLNSMGVNNTNFWSIAAKRIDRGYIDFKPLLSSRSEEMKLREYVCQTSQMSKVLQPVDLDVVTAEEVFTAVSEQFCDMSDENVRDTMAVLIQNLNTSFIMETVFDNLLISVYKKSNVTVEEGTSVINNFDKMLMLMPELQAALIVLGQDLKDEPVLAALKRGGSLKELLKSPDFMEDTGKLICGHSLVSDSNRFYQAIAATPDFNSEPDPRQLDALPSNFCRDLYKEVLSVGGGKIVWSFIKPMLMGRILYTPSSDIVEQIINNANQSFVSMAQLRHTVYKMTQVFDALDTVASHSASFDTMKFMLGSNLFENSIPVNLPSSDTLENVDYTSFISGIEDVQDMRGLIEKGSNLLECLNLNRFEAVSNEDELSHQAGKLTTINEFFAGLVFIKSDPDNIEYKIRMDIDSVPTTTRTRNQFWTPGPEDNFLDEMRYFRGFVQIQELINRAVVKSASHSRQKRQVHSLKEKSETPDFGVYTQQMPYPCYKKDLFQSGLYESSSLVACMFFALILTVASAVRFIVSERESGNKSLMQVMGMDGGCHTISWFLASYFEMLLTVTGMFLVIYFGNILPMSNPFIIWLLFANFGFSVVMFCYMISKFFNTASLGGVCSGVLYLITFMPFTVVLCLEASLTTFQKVLTSLSMSTAFSYSLIYVGRYEVIEKGIQWDNLWESPWSGDTMSVASTTLIVFFDAIIYACIGYLIEWFKEYRAKSDNLMENESENKDMGVSINDLWAKYPGNQRTVLSGVSINMRRGQVTALLGHNGAGKSTLVKIITGLLKPMKGNVFINTQSCEDSIGNVKLGVCPQNDVLIENMTAAEHFAFYTQLKTGCSYDEVAYEVKNMLVVLGAGGLAYEPVCRLSGGLRRRVCVAIAFTARPALVLLDECSSGVDPLARRDIWSLIVRLKKGRTVMLTTHHLDEAEILSDQVVIMNKGKVHTSGTPLDIKKALGDGYKMTFTFTKNYLKSPLIHDEKAKSEELTRWTGDDNVTPAERASKLLDLVQSVVANAHLCEVRRREISLMVPFYDSNGQNNDFLKITTLIESKRDDLSYDTYSMDCSSLEQVFYKICAENEKDSPYEKNDDFESVEQSSTSSVSEGQTKTTDDSKQDTDPLVSDDTNTACALSQIKALLYKRYLHYIHNPRLLFMIFVVPTLFIVLAMACSIVRPPADNEISLKLTPDMYQHSTDFYVPGEDSLNFGGRVMDEVSRLRFKNGIKQWSPQDTLNCECEGTKQICNNTRYGDAEIPNVMSLPNSRIALDWMINTHEMYIEKRYGGWSSSKYEEEKENLKVWYNNKGHHSLPAYTGALYTAALRSVTHDKANIITYSHPLKISDERISKNTVLQHVADVGISGVILVGYSLIPAAAAIYLVYERKSQEKRLQLLSGVHPITYWAATMTWDMLVICANIILSAIVMKAFGLKVFVEKDNLKAICLLLFLSGFACNALSHLLEKLFKEASLANMMLFCSNLFVGATGLAILLIMDIISNSDATDRARWIMQKIFLISPQFALGDALLEIAKNTIQAQVLKRFGMDTYKSPFQLVFWHYVAMTAVGVLLLILNLIIEMDFFENLFMKKKHPSEYSNENEMEDLDVATERYRVELNVARDEMKSPHHNPGFVMDGNEKGYEAQENQMYDQERKRDVLQALSLRKEYNAVSGSRVAVHNLTFGMAYGQCLGLLGVNGAGKSTTFSMLTGEKKQTGGQIYLNARPVNTHQLCDGDISYCPQNDALDFLLTPRQLLRFYCFIRGISNHRTVIEKTIKAFDLSKYADQKTGTLSGGNKRKLNTAIAFMGRSTVVLLDEPTSGLDASARKLVCKWCESKGRAVLVSSHSLSDVKMAATRLSLMHGGKLKAFSTPQEMQIRFGSDYMVTCRVTNADDAASVCGALHSTWPTARNITLHYSTISFLLPHNSYDVKHEEFKLSAIFAGFSKLQTQYDIEDFSINECTLDQVFVNFSAKQSETDSSSKHQKVPNDDLTVVTAL